MPAWLALVLKLIALIGVYNLLLRLLPFPARQRGWRFELKFLAVTLVSYHAALIAVEALDYLPLLGPAFAQVPLHELLGRLTLESPGKSLCGFLLSDGVILMILVLAHLLTFAKVLRVTPHKLSYRLWFLACTWVVLWLGYSALASSLGLPDPATADYAVFYDAVVGQAGWTFPQTWRGPAVNAGGAFALLCAMAVFLNLGWNMRQRTKARIAWYEVRPYRGHKVWPVVQALAYAVVAWAVPQVVLALMARWLPGLLPAEGAILPTGLQLLAGVVSLTVVLMVTWLFSKLWGPASVFRGLAWGAGRAGEVALGLLWSLLLILGIVLAGNAFGWWQVSGPARLNLGHLSGYVAILLLDALISELMFRGYVLQRLLSSFDFFTAALVSSILFALVHAFNPNVTWLGLVILGVEGLFHCYLFRMSGSLWLPITFHVGWNFFLGPVFAFPVSGLRLAESLVAMAGDTPSWLTGGAFGPEGGVLSLGLLLLSFYFYALFDGQFELASS